MSISLLTPIYNKIKKIESLVTFDTSVQDTLAYDARVWLTSAPRTETEIDNWLAIPNNLQKFNMLAESETETANVLQSQTGMTNIDTSALATTYFYGHAAVMAAAIEYLAGLSFGTSDFNEAINITSYATALLDSNAATDLVTDHVWAVNAVLGSSTCITLFKNNENRLLSFQQKILSKPTVLSQVEAAPGQQEWTTPGTYSWVVPEGVFRVAAVAVGGGGGGMFTTASAGGGGGGGLGWKSNIPVIPGDILTVEVGAGGVKTSGDVGNTDGGDSWFKDSTLVAGLGGSRGIYNNMSGGAGGTYVGDGGGNGGSGGDSGSSSYASGGGGAGGYSGNGGNGGGGGYPGNNGLGGGAGGGGGGASLDTAGAGGGVGLQGEGTSGSAGSSTGDDGNGGSGGSGGTAATSVIHSAANPSTPGVYGGGGAASDASFDEITDGANGAVRIIWPGNVRLFPSTRTANE